MALHRRTLRRLYYWKVEWQGIDSNADGRGESGRFLGSQQAVLVLRVDVNIVCGQQHLHYYLLPEIAGSGRGRPELQAPQTTFICQN